MLKKKEPHMNTHLQRDDRKRFLIRVILWAAIIRIILAVILTAGGISQKLRLSPDSERYHRVALEINDDQAQNIETRYTWQDHGWFRFTALVYRIFGPKAWIIQAFNIAASTLTVYMVAILAMAISRDIFVLRATTLFTAFFPSFIYWSCHMLKDPIAILAMTSLITATVILRQKVSVKWIVIAVASLSVFFGIRDYMFFVSLFLFLAGTLLFRKQTVERRGISAVLSLIIICILPSLLGMGILGQNFFRESHYFEMEYINHVRGAMGDHGTGAMYSANTTVAIWTEDLLQNAQVALTGLFYFFFVIDLTNINSIRQILALPEVILFVVLLPSMFRGTIFAWGHRSTMIPLLIFAFGVMTVYISATTNMGALFRWKMQIMPVLMVLMAIGIRTKPNGLIYNVGCQFLGLIRRTQPVKMRRRLSRRTSRT